MTVFGTTPLTPLESYTCAGLNYYKSLFSTAGDGRCYAIIFHSFFMRAFFDHGALGIFWAYYLTWKCLAISGYTRREILVILSFPTFSALSVSSFGTAFVIGDRSKKAGLTPGYRGKYTRSAAP